MSKMKDDSAPAEKVKLTEARLRKLIRYEQSFARLCPGVEETEIEVKKRLIITPEDLLALLDRRAQVSGETFFEEWAWPMMCRGDEMFVTESCYWDEETVEGYHGLPSEAQQTVQVYFEILFNGKAEDWDPQPAREALNSIIGMRGQAVPLRAYSDEVKENYIEYFVQKRRLNEADSKEILLFVLYTDELCAKKNPTAMRAKAYSFYGGNPAYPCNWEKSRDMLKELLELDEDPAAANALGYIYYYGRTNKGQPQYDKAFYYFSIGAAGGIVESRYKLADMFLGGYGVPKNRLICRETVWDLYQETVAQIINGDWGGSFADVAYRMGNLYRGGICVEQDADLAFFYYLQARTAIRERRKTYDYNGDDQVEASVENAIRAVLPHTSYEKAVAAPLVLPEDILWQAPLDAEDYFVMKITEKKDGTADIKITRRSWDMDAPLFVTVPEAHFSGIVKTLHYSVKKLGRWTMPGAKTGRNGTKTVCFDGIEEDEFYLNGEKTARLPGEWKLMLPKTKD